MTIQEINSLTLLDQQTLNIVKARSFSKKSPEPQYPDPLPEDFDHDIWYDSLFTQQELDDELVVYKNELIAIETERLRKKDLEDRFNNLSDMRASFHQLHPDKSNPAMFLKELLNQSDHADAEFKMQQLETKDYDLNQDPEKIKSTWVEALKKDLGDNDITMDGLLEAVVRKVILNDHTLADALKDKLEEINDRNPRP